MYIYIYIAYYLVAQDKFKTPSTATQTKYTTIKKSWQTIMAHMNLDDNRR